MTAEERRPLELLAASEDGATDARWARAASRLP
jgi:hypothetical protein